MTELWQKSAVEISKMVSSKEVSAEEVAKSHLERIAQVNPRLNALTLVDSESVERAKKFDQGSRLGKLAGVVFSSKINVDHKGYPTDDGLTFQADAIAPSTTPVISGLEDAGGTMIGRSNSPAMALRIHTDNALHGATLNPFDKAITPGGSSGGAGVAVATGMCAVAQGNDIGGSVRWPAFNSGITALRPTVGRMPTMKANTTSPRFTFSLLMSTNGPMARNIDDLWATYEAMSIYNIDDPRSVSFPIENYGPKTSRKVALISDDGHRMSSETKQALATAAKHLSDAGYEVEQVNPPMLEATFSMWERIAAPELLLNAALVEQIPDPGFVAWGRELMRKMPETNFALYFNAMAERDLICRAWTAFMQEYPLMLMITNANHTMPAAYDTKGPDAVDDIFEQMRYQFSLPTTGFPVLQVPINVGTTKPNGVQLVASMFREDLLIQAGKAIEDREGIRPVIDIAW